MKRTTQGAAQGASTARTSPAQLSTSKRRSNGKDIYLGQRIRLRRVELQISQAQLGKRLGVTFQQIQKYEMGVNRIAFSRMHEIADALEVSMAFFIGEDGKIPEPTEMTTFIASPCGIRLIEASMKLSEFHCNAVINLVRSLAELD